MQGVAKHLSHWRRKENGQGGVEKLFWGQKDGGATTGAREDANHDV